MPAKRVEGGKRACSEAGGGQGETGKQKSATARKRPFTKGESGRVAQIKKRGTAGAVPLWLYDCVK
ncbi:MAG: hypothetical protein A2052_02625 [Deltaproteobacteria bacterium GWA2_54_12]|nr:MAG: hypothetical protein A2052_02625 [Deltaproteobacteria bacterium GWA2_54_12]